MLKIVLRPHRATLRAGEAGEQKVFAMLKLIPDAVASGARPPLALCLAVDTSASMQAYADQEAARAAALRIGAPGLISSVDGGSYEGFSLALPTLLTQAIQAAHTMVDDPRLLPTDLVSLAHFDDRAHTLLPLTPVARRSSVHAAIESLSRHGGGTRMAGGLRCALGELSRLGPEVAKRALVLTDGAAADEDECLGLLPLFARANAPLIGIGFGGEYNAALLGQMADATQGRPYHIQQMADLSQVLQVEVGQTAREVVTDLKATISTSRGVRVDAISRVHPALIAVAAGAPHRLGNIAAGDFSVFIIEMTVSELKRPPSRVRLAQVGLSATAPGLARVEEFPPLDLFVEFAHGEAAASRVDSEVVGYMQQKNVGRMVEDAMRLANIDAAPARQTLRAAVEMTQRLGNGALTQILNAAIGELDSRGTISVEMSRAVALGLRTKTVKTAAMDLGIGDLSPGDLRRLSGT